MTDLSQGAAVSPDSVLIVDDEAFVRFFVSDLFEDRGYTVYEAANADDAILVMEQHPGIGLVVTDIQMPGSMDGVKLSHYITERWPPTRLIVTSGKPAQACAQLPPNARFLSKPIDTAQLFSAVGCKG